MSTPDPILLTACPICNETRVHHERVYTIRGQRVVMRFASCLHSPEEIADATRAATPTSTPPASS
jgi:hypothetical protein